MGGRARRVGATKRRALGLLAVGGLGVVLSVGLTSAAWVDEVHLQADVTAGSFDIQARFSPAEHVAGHSTAEWDDVGLPGNPDTFTPGFEVVIPPIENVVPSHSYLGEVFLCNAGDLDGVITQADLIEEGPGLIQPGSILVDGIDVGSVIPARSCTPSSVDDPPNDLHGDIRFMTVSDFTGLYGVTTTIRIRIWVTAIGTTWEDRGASEMLVSSIRTPPPPVNFPVDPDPTVNGTARTTPVWSGTGGAANPTALNFCFTTSITTTSATAVPWQLILNTGQPPFDNVPPYTGFQGSLFGENSSYNFTQAPDYAATGNILVTPQQPFQYASSTTPYSAKICAVNTPEPQWQPSGLSTYTQTTLQLVRNGSQPCIAGTVQGHQPYFVGFSVDFNWRTFLDQQLGLGTITQAEHDQWLTYTHWAGGPPGFNAAQGATGSNYEVQLRGYSADTRAVANFALVTIASCAY